ncbi:FLX-like 4 isoform X1, putative [Babesia ovata]|uniref:FLX-like 4 isoform X1, putative n=1 Tax=Babesia ovata TaxID=189622 RepID=A0A2H6KI78_9APIC|nr:FLX-like 4 isoform X1, putative [Babesia ovata]GBE62693.1 FLX-like 4 isoform X1, putative [Babesia ovata]
MSLSLETSAGYIDSEYSDFEHVDPLSTIGRSSPKFGRDDMKYLADRNVTPGLLRDTETISEKQPQNSERDGFTLSHCYVEHQRSNPFNSELRLSRRDGSISSNRETNVEFCSDESCRADTVNNEFKWWCDEQEASDFSLANTGEDVTPIKFEPVTPIEERKILNALQAVQLGNPQQMSDRTRCGSTSSDDCESNESLCSAISSPRGIPEAQEEEWSSFMKPADSDLEIDLLKEQILHRLGLKLTNVRSQGPLEKQANRKCDAGSQTSEDGYAFAYKDYEIVWLRNVNGMLTKQFIELISGGKLMAYKTDQRFIECLQSHLSKSQTEIDRLLRIKPDQTNCKEECHNDNGLIDELAAIRAQNLDLKKEVEALKAQLQQANETDAFTERIKALEQKLGEEKLSKMALMEDFNKTLGYMRLMKDRLKILSEEKCARLVAPSYAVKDSSRRGSVGDYTNKSTVKPNTLKGCVKRSNTTNCAPSKQDRVKFAETSDVYYLPKRSNSELGPFLVDSKRQMPILPCKIRPVDPKATPENSSGLMGFIKSIKQTFTNKSDHTSPRANVLKIPNSQESQTQQKLAMYKRHLLSRGLS